MPSVEKVERNARILELHVAGLSFNKIVRQLVADGYDFISPQRVGRIIKDRV